MRQLTKIHAEEGIISEHENRFLQAALTHHDQVATDIMTKMDQVFRISISSSTFLCDFFEFVIASTISLNLFCIHIQSVLTRSLIKEVRRAGFSRIPLYGESSDNIVGILHLKDLILVDPAVLSNLDRIEHFSTYSLFIVGANCCCRCY